MTKITNAIEKIIVRETAKAVCVNVCTGRGIRRDVWFPKSQVEIKADAIVVAAWLMAKKDREVGGIITLSSTVAAKLAA